MSRHGWGSALLSAAETMLESKPAARPALQMGSVVFGPGTTRALNAGISSDKPALTVAPAKPKKGIWVVVDKEEKAIALMLTKGLNGPQQAVAKSIRLRADGRFSTTMSDAWKDHGVAVVFAVDKQARFWEALVEVAPVPFPREAVWMAME